MNQLTPITKEVFGFMRSKQQTPVQQVIDLVNKGEIKKALEIANTLSDEDKNKIPDSILFKFSQLAEMSMTGTGASFSGGSGEGFATKYAFGRKPKKKKIVRKKLASMVESNLTSIVTEIYKNIKKSKNH